MAKNSTNLHLEGTRYLRLKHDTNLKPKQLQDKAWLTRTSLALKTARAARWIDDFNGFYDQDTPAAAEAYLIRWCYGAKRSRLDPIKKFVANVENHWDGILTWATHRITNGLLEGTNSLALSSGLLVVCRRSGPHAIARCVRAGGRPAHRNVMSVLTAAHYRFAPVLQQLDDPPAGRLWVQRNTKRGLKCWAAWSDDAESQRVFYEQKRGQVNESRNAGRGSSRLVPGSQGPSHSFHGSMVRTGWSRSPRFPSR